MNYLITGGTGFLGQQLVNELRNTGHHVYILTRSPKSHKDTDNTFYINYDTDIKKLPVFEGVINLAGESIFGYWSDDRKKSIIQSRLSVTDNLLKLIRKMSTKPNVWVNGSAVGYYGMSENDIYTEETTEASTDFLATVAKKWEDAASKAKDMGIRTVYTRFGVILGKGGGAFPLMSLPVKLFAGGKIGSGQQWLSWVHIDDVVGLIIHCLTHDQISGPVNVTSPNPKRNKDFMKQLAKALRRPYFVPTPSLIIRIGLGEMSQLITKGQYVIPKQALDTNYSFKYAELNSALKDLTSR